MLQALAKMIAPGSNPQRERLPRQDQLAARPSARTPRQSLNNRKLSGFLPGTPRRSSFRNTAFMGQTSRARSLRKDVETPARVNRLADIHTPSDLLRLLTRMPDFQKILSPTQTSDQPEQDLNVLPMQGSQAQTPEAPSGRESILPNMSLLELHEQFQLLDDDEKSFVRDSLEFGFRHHRNRRDLTSSDGMERQRRMTYNSDATFGDSMWEDEEEEQDMMDEEMNEEGSAIPPVAHDVAHASDLGRDPRYYEEAQDEIDLTAKPEKKLSSIEEIRDTLQNVAASSPHALEQEEDMPLDFGPNHDQEEHYEVDQELLDHHPTQEHLESKHSSGPRPKLQPRSPMKPPERPPVQVTLAQLAARNGSDTDPFRRDVKAPAQKVSEAGVVVPNLPKALIKDLFSSFAKTKVSREALEAVMEASHQFFAQVSEDLSVYASHAGRIMIQESDVQCLMRRQRVLNDKVSMESLAHKHLPRELWDEICVSALANNELHPNRQQQK
ncbi:unnamed protein product [Umbelopsis vinacea]